MDYSEDPEPFNREADEWRSECEKLRERLSERDKQLFDVKRTLEAQCASMRDALSAAVHNSCHSLPADQLCTFDNGDRELGQRLCDAARRALAGSFAYASQRRPGVASRAHELLRRMRLNGTGDQAEAESAIEDAIEWALEQAALTAESKMVNAHEGCRRVIADALRSLKISSGEVK